MTTERALAQRIFRTWRITNHCREQMAERGIAPTELIDCLVAHEPAYRVQDQPDSFVIWNDHIGVVYKETIELETGNDIKLVITVLLNGSGKADWEGVASEKAQRRAVDAFDLDDMLEWALNETAPPEAKYKAPKRPKVAPVATRNAFDDMPSHMMKTVRKTLIQMGLDPDDMRPVRVVGNRIDIDPTRLKRAG